MTGSLIRLGQLRCHSDVGSPSINQKSATVPNCGWDSQGFGCQGRIGSETGYDFALNGPPGSFVCRYFRDQAMVFKMVGGAANPGKRDTGAFGDIEKRVVSIREIQNPKHGQIVDRDFTTSGSPVETSFPQLWFAEGIHVQIPAIPL